MKKILGIVAVMLLLCMIFVGCGKKTEQMAPVEEKGGTPVEEKGGTLEEIGYTIDEDDKTMEKLVTLDEVYFPEGFLETGFGMFIWDAENKTWERTSEPEGKKLFDPEKSIMLYTHGMGGNGTGDNHDLLFEKGYNVLNFRWGACSDEYGKDWYLITDKIWYRTNLRWLNNDNVMVENDVPNRSVAEIYGAYYYDLLSAFPEYSGAETVIYGHSYGGMLTCALASYILTAYKSGLLPANMLISQVHLLDPYFSRGTNDALGEDIPWLVGETPAKANVVEAVYKMSEDARTFGVAIGLFRTSKSVCYPTTLNEFGTDLTGSYWDFCNNIVYTHLNDGSIPLFAEYDYDIHGYGRDWVVEFYDGEPLYDSSSTKITEEAYSLAMSYDAMFARYGIKYDLDLNGTLYDVRDDIFTDFRCNYNTVLNDAAQNESEEILATYIECKAKIAGFVYYDRNGNGKMDEAVRDHFSGAKVVICDEAGNTVYETETELNGYYEAEVGEGKYTIKVCLSNSKYSLVSAEKAVEIVDGNYQLSLNHFAVTK